MMDAILSSDWIKMRRAWFWRLVVLYPFSLIGIVSLGFLTNLNKLTAPDQIWGLMWLVTYYTDYMAIHLIITLFAVILANIEHQANSWKLLLSTPISRIKFYFTKCMWLIVGFFCTRLLLLVGYLLVGMGFGAEEELNMSRLFSFTLFPFFTSFGIIGVQLWLSTVIKNQSLPIVLGGVGAFVGIYALGLPDFLAYNPWSLPYHVLYDESNLIQEPREIKLDPVMNWDLSIVSGLIGVIFFVLGSIHFAKRDVE